VEAAMFKLLYKPVAIVAGIVGSVLSGLIYGRDPEYARDDP
jgi:hypothetical protein